MHTIAQSHEHNPSMLKYFFYFQFIQQYHHFESMLKVFRLQPDKFIKGLDDLVIFVAQVSHCYPDEVKEFPQEIVELLKTHHMVLNSEMRMVRLTRYFNLTRRTQDN